MMLVAWRARKRYKVAQVAVFSGKAFIWAEAVCCLLRLVSKPYILTLHGGDLPAFAQRYPKRVRRLLISAKVVTTPSRYLKEAMQAYRPDLLLVPNPVNLDSTEFKLRSKPRPNLVWLRAFHQIYNPSLAIRVVALLADEFPDVRLTMVGPDKGDGSLPAAQQLAEELGVQEKVNFIGGVPKGDVPAWLNKGDIFINTTDVDNTPISVLEAMACGLCVVSTNVGGIPYLLDDQRNALLVPPNDAEMMAAAVRRILLDSSLAKRLSGSARMKTEGFSWSKVLPIWEELFQATAASVNAQTKMKVPASVTSYE
jgi:glycosyltransferase involved in cell wall biosynthesis